MSYLNFEHLDTIDPKSFQQQRPYPWLGIANSLTAEGYERLLDNLPPVERFKRFFDKPRGYGQQPHNRFTLEYERGLDIPTPWAEFIAELEGPHYQRWLARMLGTRSFLLSYHWHYTPNGCSVSPHCDSRRKLGSHIFYLNREGEWDPAWGGQTVVLDDGGRFAPKSAPGFDDFLSRQSAPSVGNCSLLFRRRGNSWHGVQEIRCPEDRMRKVFIMVINANGAWRRLKRWMRRKPLPGY